MGPEFATLFDGLGWAILHSLWQGALAAIAVVLFRNFTKDSQAALRYGFQSLCLLFCLVAFIATFGIYQLQATQAPAPSNGIFLSLTTLGSSVAPSLISPPEVISGGTSLSAGHIAPYMPLVGVLWVIGFSVLALKYTTAFVMTQRLRREGLSPVPATWARRFATLALNTGIRRDVAFFISSKVKSPLTLGFFKPVVLVPVGFFANLPADQVEAILLHELGHIRRHDYLVNLLQTAIKTIFFFHPAVHYISRKIDHDREHACDDFAVAFNHDPDALIRGLAALRMTLSRDAFALAADDGNTPLVNRLKRLGEASDTHRRPEQVMTSVLALLVATGFYVASSPFADAQPAKVGEDSFSETLTPEPISHPSAKKNNYTFKQITKDGRTFTAKIAEDGTRWINVKGNWYDIDRTPHMIAKLPVIPIAPDAPVLKTNLELSPEMLTGINDLKLDQFNINTDYYVASANHYEDLAGAPKAHRRDLEKQIEAAEKAREDAMERAERIREEALERAEKEIEREMERAQAQYERAMEQAERQREIAEEQRDRAMEQAEANRERAMAHAEREREQAERQAEMAERQREMMEAQLERAEEQRERAMERAEERRERAMEQAEREHERAERRREREEHRQERLEKHAKKYKKFSDEMMLQLKSDGLVDARAKTVTITYPNKKMAVNGKLVSRNLEGNYCELLEAYNIKKTAHTRIKISPSLFEYTSRSNDGRSRHNIQETLEQHAKFEGPNPVIANPILSAPKIEAPKLTPISFTPPTQSAWISSPYGQKTHHKHTGVDLAAPHSSSVVASAPGIVTSAQLDGKWGKRVTISHANGYKTRYAHMDKICVKPGQKVKKGQRIGNVGSTGNSSGPHLHFEIHHENETQNPEHFIRGLGKT